MYYFYVFYNYLFAHNWCFTNNENFCLYCCPRPTVIFWSGGGNFFRNGADLVNFYKKTARFWGENEFFLFSLLERRLESFVLRSNLINSIYFIKKFIENGNVMINNIMVTNPLRVLQLGEIVSINKKYSKLIYFSLKSRLLKRKVILNFPDFIELDYKLLVGMVIRPPSFASLTKPVSFDLYTSFLSVNNH